jgi:hypothetical protein
MTRTGYAKGGANAGHITQERTLKPKPSSRKGVRCLKIRCIYMMYIYIYYIVYIVICKPITH